MKHVKIWQLPLENDYKFLSYRPEHFNFANYECKYECDRPDTYTEDSAWNEFNCHHPADYNTHSLSVSDIVEIDGVKIYCDSFGWKELD